MTRARRRQVAGCTALLACVVGTAPALPQALRTEFTSQEIARILKHSPLPPAPPDETNQVADDPAAARLGQALFFETRLSSNGQVSCATCHDPQRSFADGRALAQALGRGRRHTPSLWNVAYNRWFFWDGRADALWSQALKPIETAVEMGGSRLAVAALLTSDARLGAAYEQVFGALPAAHVQRRWPRAGGPLAEDLAGRLAWAALSEAEQLVVDRIFANVGKALAAYQRRLLSRRAPFDVFVEGLRADDAGKLAALTPAARRGLKLFLGRGNCALCHAGPTFSDLEFHDIGVPLSADVSAPDPGRLEGVRALLLDPFAAGGLFSDDREGPRARATRFVRPREDDLGLVKTPTLRNVARTPPYMHQGQFATLRDVLHFYSTHEGRRGLPARQERVLVPLHLDEHEAQDLSAFLVALVDESLDESLRHPPELGVPDDVTWLDRPGIGAYSRASPNP
jgi:cytochrome c peroxidase